MLLRRVTEHTRSQNWTAVAIDFFIVIIGVFIGLQASNWNQERTDRRDEARFLAQLYAEAAAAEKASSRIVQVREGALDGAISAMDVLYGRTDREELSYDECQSLRATSLIGIRFVELPSFDELVSSGRLNIIRDDELRGALVELKQNVIAADRSINQLLAFRSDLVRDFPEAFDLTSTIIPEVTTRREVGVESICNTTWMENSKAFINAAAMSLDSYDAFVRDIVTPWQAGVEQVNNRLSIILDIEDKTD